MSVVIEPLQGAVSIFATGPCRAPLPRVAPCARGIATERWKSTLSSKDLQCLLQVIENDLIPQMLTEYSPARHAPLGSGGASG